MKRFFPFIGLVVVLTINFLANYLPIGGMTTGQMSDAYPSLFTPAGFTFSIWGLIYLSLIGYVFFQAFSSNTATGASLKKVNQYFLINCVANSSWILAWHYHYIFLSLLIMIVILGSLILIYREILTLKPLRWASILFLKIPFSLYLGWISVATLANVSVLQVATNTQDLWLQESEWALIKIAAAGAIASVMLVRYQDFVFAAVVAWAAFGIYSANFSGAPMVAGSAISIMILLMVVGVIERIKGWVKL